MTFLLAGALAAAATAGFAQSAAEQRVALVVGNGRYVDQPLANPPNDARAVAASLRKLGFTVIERIDAGRKGMEDAILEFGDKLRAGGVGLFYYAGHGIQSGGRNYLMPVDVTVRTEAQVRVYGLDANLVLDLMADARNHANVVILDACRNNPFVMASRGAKGLAAIDAARGTLIAYSTAPGQVAVDGDGANSPYTGALVKALDAPGLKAEEVFKQVRRQVVDATKGAQTPWESSSLTGDLILNLTVVVAPPQPQPQAQTPAQAPANRDAVEAAFWNSIAASGDPQDFRDYLKQFPNGTFAGLANRRIADLQRKSQEAEAEKKRLAAAESERKRIAADEEKKRQAADAEKRRLAAQEEERKRQQQAALPPPASPPGPRQIAYDRVMGVLLGQTVQSGTDLGKRNDYRATPKPKAIAACLDWSGGTADRVTVGPWASSWIPPGSTGIPPRQDALTKCERGNTTPNRCKCQLVDEDDRNVIEVPRNVAVASAAPSQQAALPAPSASAAAKTKWDGTWKVWLKRRRGDYVGEAVIKDGRVKLRARADIYMMVGEGQIDDSGTLAMRLKLENRPDTFPLNVKFKDNVADGTWDPGYPAKLTRQ